MSTLKVGDIKHESFTGTTQLKLDSAGNVGIGTTSPSGASGKVLEINGGSGQARIVLKNSTTGSASTDGHQIFSDGTTLGIQNREAGSTTFETNGSERMRITGDGPHLLLGGTADVNEITESSANTGMVIGNTSMGNGGLAIINSTSGTGRIYFGDDVGGNSARNRGQINYYHSSDYMMFATAGSERMRIDSSGNVGVSTTSPVAQTNSSSDALTPVLDLKGTGTNNNESGVLQLTRKDNATQGSCIYNSGDDGGLCLRNTDANGISIWNGTTRSVYVRNNGTVQFRHATSSDATGESNNWTSFNSVSASSYDLKIMNNAADPAATYSVELKAKAAVDNTTYRHFQCTRNNNSTGVFVVFGNGNVQNANNSYGQTSDVKLKENIVDANSQWDDIKGLRVRNFNFKADSGYSTHKQIGLIAQEAETVSAGLIESVADVAEDENGIKTETGTTTKQLKYSVLYMKAIKALQEAIAKIEVLETKVAALEAG